MLAMIANMNIKTAMAKITCW